MAKLGDKLGFRVIPMVTPFRDDEEVDYGVTERLVEHMIGKKLCDSIVVAGTTGEFHALSFEERVELFRVVKRAAASRVPVVAGTGAASTREAIRLTQEAEKVGCDAVMVVGPYYCRPDEEGVYQHYKAVAESTRLPIMLYNIPIFVGINVGVGVVSRLARIPNIVGIKDEAGINPTQMTDYALATPPDFTIYNGDDVMVLCGMVQGASGVVTGISAIFGEKMLEMIKAFLAGKVGRAQELQRYLHPFIMGLFPNGRVNPIPLLKAAIELAGIPVGPPRRPLSRATDAERAEMRKRLEAMKVI